MSYPSGQDLDANGRVEALTAVLSQIGFEDPTPEEASLAVDLAIIYDQIIDLGRAIESLSDPSSTTDARLGAVIGLQIGLEDLVHHADSASEALKTVAELLDFPGT